MGGACSSPKDDSLKLVEGVDADMLAKEIRVKFTPGGGTNTFAGAPDLTSKAAEEIAKVLEKHLPQLKAIDGLTVGRIVCGGCNDFKVVISGPVGKFKAWEAKGFSEANAYIADLKKVDGLGGEVEEQIYTLTDMHITSPAPETEAALSLFPGVEFQLLAREWRCKWKADEGSPEGGALFKSKSLEEVQTLLNEYMPKLQGVDGVSGVQRVVCGTCKDFKVITFGPTGKIAAWEGKEFEPEKEFLEKLGKIDGVTAVENQKYTIAKM